MSAERPIPDYLELVPEPDGHRFGELADMIIEEDEPRRIEEIRTACNARAKQDTGPECDGLINLINGVAKYKLDIQDRGLDDLKRAIDFYGHRQHPTQKDHPADCRSLPIPAAAIRR